MVEKIFVEVEPEVLIWAIKSAGYEYLEISKKISDNETTVEEWIKKEKKPTWKQLEKLSIIVKRPVASFLLSKAPEEKPLPKDFRMLPGKEGKFDKKTMFAIRKARSLQKLTKELSGYLNEENRSKVHRAELKDNPETLAARYREEFGITNESQAKFKTHYEFYNYLREKLEEINVFPFQISMPLDDARGFALSDDFPYVIVVNSKDMIEARIFTIMHEFGHILLNETGVDIPEFTSSDKVEKWCNEFSSNFLFPKDLAKSVFESKKETLTDTKTLNWISNKYNISKAMVLYNMVKMGFLNWGDFNLIMGRYKAPVEEGQSSAVPIERKRLSEMGNKFVSLVAGNLDKKNITYSDALGYLSIKSKKLSKLMGKAKG
jgi:Zn-dependent peptidase ImmA (M78 family)